MGCKCCKMIKSYIFHPQEVQTAAYVNEINNYKSEEEERGNFHCKQNSDILAHRNELQVAECQRGANQCRYNHSRDALWSSRISALREKGFENSVGKYSVNGNHSSINLSAPHPKTQPKVINPYLSSDQLPGSPDKRDFQPKLGGQRNTLDPEHHPKQTLETSDALRKEGSQTTAEPIFSIQCTVPEIRDQDIQLDSPSFLPKGHRVENSRPVENENFSNHLVQVNRITESPAVICNWDPPCGDSDGVDSVWRTSPFSLSFEDEISAEIWFGGKKGEPTREARFNGLAKVNGELEEDAEVAEALAALEAATAGEVFEEEEEND